MAQQQHAQVDIPLEERLIRNIEELRLLGKEYHLLSDDQKRGIRNKAYSKTGGFGRALLSDKEANIMERFHDIEEKLINANKA